MKERSSITILVVSLVILGVLCVCMDSLVTKFTFSTSELQISGNTIIEKLTYKPFFKEYHTLYRNFLTPIETHGEDEYITITTVRCGDGLAYYNDFNNQFNSLSSKTRLAYTEKNEYGCSFGNVLGFKKGNNYTVAAEYILNAKNLFKYQGKTYIKFIAYSKDAHPVLIRNKNLILNSDVYSKKIYLISEDVIIYVPYNPEDISKYSTKSLNKLEFDNTKIFFNLIFAIIPAMICWLIWLKYGRENTEGDYPEELSQYPKERKAWEVAAYFHPPFGQAGGTLLPATIIDFYNRKIIDIKETNKHSQIKILQEEPNIDDVENVVLNFLKEARKQSSGTDGYFSLEEINKDMSKAKIMHDEYEKIERIISSKSNEYVSNKGVLAIIVFMMIMTMICIKITNNGYMVVTYFVSLLVVIIVMLKTSLFARFKKDYYLEYQQWQGFKNYLSHLDSIPRTSYKGVVMWEKYLIYASALGIGKKVLDTLKKWKVINEKQYNSFNSISTSAILSSASTRSSGGGGFGGGGGMGGGGGGGR
jgi:hypothetical protein